MFLSFSFAISFSIVFLSVLRHPLGDLPPFSAVSHGGGCWGWAQVLEAAGKHQVLIFVHSRKETAKTARYLKEEALKEDKLALFMGGVRSLATPNYFLFSFFSMCLSIPRI